MTPSRGRRTTGAALLPAVLLLAGCAPQATLRSTPVEAVAASAAQTPPLAAPAVDSDEAGLWLRADKAEAALRASGRVLDDPELQAYVEEIVCRLAPEHCGGVRVHLVRAPQFNATMAPNGFMEVWTGLLLRAENEAQLAYVVGHELGHYLRRHAVLRWRDLRGKLDAGAFLGFATGLGPLVQLAALGSVYAYGRDQEREADDIGLALVSRAGYDPRQAPPIWAGLVAEREAEDDDRQSIFFASHPDDEERMATLEQRAAGAAAGGEINREGHLAVVRPRRGEWLADELRLRRHEAMLVLLERLRAAEPHDPELLYFRGETLRLRGEQGDDALALAAFREAVAAGSPRAEVHRSIGLTLWRMGREREAAAALRDYLEAEPDASDAMMIRRYIEELG